MENSNQETNAPGGAALWIPRALIAISCLLAVYLLAVSYSLSGRYDESFLAEENLGKIRGPLAKEMYYVRGLPDYQGLPLFMSEPTAASDITEGTATSD